MFTFNVICSSVGRVYTIQVEADTTEQAEQKVKAMAKEQGIKNLRITAVVQVK
jgi:phosphoribosylformylglycinamidine (FGAM) synthase PurS component